MATKVAKRRIHKPVVKAVKHQPSPAAAISAAYEHAEHFIEAQRDLLRGLIENLSEQFARRAPKVVTVTKVTHARPVTRKHVVAHRPAKHSA